MDRPAGITTVLGSLDPGSLDHDSYGILLYADALSPNEDSTMTRTSCLVMLLLAIAAFGAPASASFELPNTVYRIDQLDEAVDAARRNDVPVTFLYTDENTDCPLATAASLDDIEYLKDVTVVVYVDSGERQDWNRTPIAVKRAINSPDAGRYIPVAVIVDDDLTTVRAIVPYVRDVADRRSNLRNVRSAIRQ